jgi:hypothetical protein
MFLLLDRLREIWGKRADIYEGEYLEKTNRVDIRRPGKE